MQAYRVLRACARSLLPGLLLLLPVTSAHAVPSFARQTGMECASCHTVFPQLTAFGRQFKLQGYTLTNNTKGHTDGLEEDDTPPLSAMIQISYNATKKRQPDSAVSGQAVNGNVLFPDQLSLFYAGRIDGKMGAFLQLTYDGADDHFGMDNADIRVADNTTLAGGSLAYGLTLNNSPTVQDLWNSTPVWGFPYAASKVAPSPAAATLLDGTLGQQVAGLGVYGLWSNLVYAEVSGYRTSQIGTAQPPDSTSSNVLAGTSPYWRLALTRDWGGQSLMVGALGMKSDVYPGGGTALSGPTNTFTDTALDTQYQYQADKNSLTVHAIYINEKQDWGAGGTSNASDKLKTFRTDATYYYDHRYGGSLGYFNTHGDADAALYTGESVTGSPDSNGWIAELDYVPWLNTKLGLQYVRYNKFNGGSSNYDGSGRSASDNNTVFASAWLMF